jgi:integrase/recombinase XerD
MTKVSAEQKQRYRVPDSLASEYLAVNDSIALKQSSVSTYDSHLTEYVGFLHQHDDTVLTASITDVIDFIEACVGRANRQSTIEGKLTAISELYRYIRLRTDAGDELQLDPLRFREIDLDRYNTPEPIEREALSREEIRLLFDAFNSYRNRLMTIVGVETGIRNSDIRCLRLQDIEARTLHVHDPKNSRPYEVPISDQLRFELDTWISSQRKGFAASATSDYVFPSQHGEKLESNSTLTTIVREAAERAGIQEINARSPISEEHQELFQTDKTHREWHRVTPHTLRHSYITLLKEADVSLPYRQLVANHVDSQTTRVYSHGSKESVFESIREDFRPPR